MLTKKLAAFVSVTAIALGLSAPLVAAPEPNPANKLVEISVTEKGFEPSSVTLKKDEPVTLVVTRKTDKTCAREILIEVEKINVQLPLNEAVKIPFTPKRGGEIKFTCGMKMFEGVLKVE